MGRIGLPARHLSQVRYWYEVFARSLANFEHDPEVHEQGQRAARSMKQYLADRLAEEPRSRDGSEATLIGALTGPDCVLERSEILANLLIVLLILLVGSLVRSFV